MFLIAWITVAVICIALFGNPKAKNSKQNIWELHDRCDRMAHWIATLQQELRELRSVVEKGTPPPHSENSKVPLEKPIATPAETPAVTVLPEKPQVNFGRPEPFREFVQPLPVREMNPYYAPPIINNKEDEYEAEPEKTPIEKWIGQRLFGLIAAVLIFAGLVYFATLIYDKFSDGAKITLMYIISAGLTFGGMTFVKTKRNYFTLSLAGCGFGGFYITTLMAHAHFGIFADYFAFSLLLIWAWGVLSMSKRLETGLFSVITHIGVAISLFFIYTQPLRTDKLWLILIYQWASFAVITVGSLKYSKETYKSGLFMSAVFTFFASGAMGIAFFVNSLEAVHIFGFIGQFACASVLSFFIARSAGSDSESVFVQTCNMVLWFATLCVSVIAMTDYLVLEYFENIYLGTVALTVGFAVILAYIALTVYLRRKQIISETAKFTTVIALGVFSSWLLIISFFGSFTYHSLNVAVACVLIQFFCVTVTSFLVTRIAERIVRREWCLLLQLLNKLFWFASLCMNILFALYLTLWSRNIPLTSNAENNIIYSVGLIAIAIHTALSIILGKNGRIKKATVLLMTVFSAFLLTVRYVSFNGGTLPFMFVLAAAMFMFYKKTGVKIYLTFANILLAFDALLMFTAYDYLYDKSELLPIIYLIGTVSLMTLQRFFINSNDKEIYAVYAALTERIKIISYVITQITVLKFLGVYGLSDISVKTVMIFLMLLNIVLYILKFAENSLLLTALTKISRYFLLLTGTVMTADGYSFAITILTFTLAFVNIKKTFGKDSNKYSQILAGIKLSILVLCLMVGFTGIESNSAYSIVCMLTTLVCILAGFKFQAEYLRLYGLVVTILCVIKLVMIDVASSDIETPMRVVAMIAGGLICFAINAAYNYAVKTFDKDK